MRHHYLPFLFCVIGLAFSAPAHAQLIRGEYVETRSADVYTGQCFANGEVNLVGNEAILAWHVRSGSWDIVVSKTGFLNEAGRCLVMQAKITGKPIIIVLLDSWGKNTRIGDANRIKKWMETGFARKVRG